LNVRLHFVQGNFAVIEVLENISFQYVGAEDSSFSQKEHTVSICSLQAIVLSYRRKIRSLIYHKLNVRLHFTHSDTNIIFLPIWYVK